MGGMRGRGKILLLGLLIAAIPPGAAMAQNPDGPSGGEAPSFETPTQAEAVPGQIIVKFEEDATRAEEADARRDEGLVKEDDLELIDAEVAEVEGQSVEQAIRDLERRPEVEYAEPDYIRYPSGYSDEPRFRELWGLNNTGQSIQGSPGSRDADVNGSEASKVTRGNPNLVVAVIDDGVDFSHHDLAGRKWVNPGESGADASGRDKATNGADDDGNGYVDDVNGWDFVNNDNTVHNSPRDTHGTHVAGTIAASVNGGGVVGVAPNVKIMALNFLGRGPNSGTISKEIQAIEYAKTMGARISNNSYGGPGSSQAEEDAIEDYGQFFAAAAGNVGANNDNPATADYPAAYDSPNIVSVAAINNKGALADFSNYGATSVDISAPGVSILSTLPGKTYGYRNGTSMATSHVTGAAALAASVNPALLGNPTALKKKIMDSGKPARSTARRTVTGDVVDAAAAVGAPVATRPPSTGAPLVRSVSPANAARNIAVRTNVGASFSEKMNEASVEAAGAFTLRKRGETARVAARVTYDPAGKRVTLDPTSNLQPGTTYVAVVKGGTGGAKDASGNALAKDKVWSFTTSGRATPPPSADPDNERPEITQRSPKRGTRDRTPTIRATVRDAESNLSAEDVELRVDGERVEARYNAETDRLSYTPREALARGKHEVEIVATDSEGASSTRTWTFKVRRADNTNWWGFMRWWMRTN